MCVGMYERKEIKHKNSNERDKLVTMVTMMMERIV